MVWDRSIESTTDWGQSPATEQSNLGGFCYLIRQNVVLAECCFGRMLLLRLEDVC